MQGKMRRRLTFGLSVSFTEKGSSPPLLKIWAELTKTNHYK